MANSREDDTRTVLDELREGARFEIRQRLGEGGMGVVYRAFDKTRAAEVALKTLPRMDATSIARLKREFRALADVAHPNLVALYELISTGNAWFFTMELVFGVDFVEYIRDPESGRAPGGPAWASRPTPSRPAYFAQGKPRPDIARLRRSLRQLTHAIEAIHDAGKLHLDLKPSNVLVGVNGRVVVLDFGLVRDTPPDGAPESSRDLPIVGTPTYMAPEQSRGERLSPAADWYAVGGIIYYALTGRAPFEGDPHVVLTMKQYAVPHPPSDLTDGVPSEISDLCMALLARDPKQRANGDDVQRTLGGPRVTPVPMSRAPAPPKSTPSSEPTPGDPAERNTHPARGSRPQSNTPVPPSAPFVGRAAALAELDAALAEAVNGKPVAVFIHGSSGIGKTALVGHFLGGLRARRAAKILAGRCHERESVPFKAFDSVVDALCAHLRSLRPDQAAALLNDSVHDLARLFPAILDVPAAAEIPPRSFGITSPQEARARAFRAIKELLSALARQAPLVLYIDDLQWGDRDSALLLLAILSPPDPPPLLVLGAYRTEEEPSSAFLTAIFGEGASPGAAAPARTIKLDPLSPIESVELARALLEPHDDSGRRRAESVAREAEGSPFFVTELARSLRADTSPAPDDHGGEQVEATIERLLVARVERLPSDARRILEVVAVAGRPIEQGIAIRAAKLLGDGHAALAALRSGHLVRTRGASQSDAVEIYHDRIRKAVLSQIPPDRLTVRHLYLARALESAGAAEPEALALHFCEAGDREAAGRAAVDAAEAAMRALAFDNAARLYKLAIDQGPGGDARGRDLRMKLGDALMSAGRGGEAAAAYLGAAAGAPQSQALDRKRRAAEQLLISGRVEEGMPLMREVLAGAGLLYPSSSAGAFAALLLDRARLAIRGLSFEERDASSIEPATLAKLDACRSAFVGIGVLDPIRSAGYIARYLLLSLGAGEPNRIAVGLAWDALYRVFSGSSARASLKAAEDLARRLDNASASGLVSLVKAVEAWGQDRFRSAADHAEEAERILRERGDGAVWAINTAAIVQASCLFALGELTVLSKRLAAWLREADERRDYYAMTSLRTNAGAAAVVALAAGDPARARAEIDRAMAVWPSSGAHMQHLGALQSRVLVDLYEGDGEAALRRVEETMPALRRSPIVRGRVAGMAVDLVEGVATLGAAARAGDPSPLLAAVEVSARRIEAEGGKGAAGAWPVAGACVLRASAAALRGDAAAARALLLRAIAGFDAASMALHAAVARRRLGAVVGGSEGRGLIVAADVFMAGQGVRFPERLTSALAPGFERG